MNLQIFEHASDWVVKHRDGELDAREKQAFDAWLRESPQHLRAYLEMSSVWEDVPSLDPSWNLSADELIARARADDNVVPLSPKEAQPLAAMPLDAVDMPTLQSRGAIERQVHATKAQRVKWFYALAASLLIAVISAGTFYFQRDVYTTDVGEQRSLSLADGSTVELNSRSRIKIRYTDQERRIDLLEGQALFNVAQNKTRPFIVQTSDTRIRAVGTAFDVYEKSSGTVVTVVEGRVDVRKVSSALVTQSQWDSDSAGVLVSAGEQFVVKPAVVSAPKPVNVASATAWTQRNLVFDSASLAEVAQEFNRYNTRRLVVDSAELADFHVSGVFSSAEPKLLLRFLHSQPELIVEETQEQIRITKRQ